LAGAASLDDPSKTETEAGFSGNFPFGSKYLRLPPQLPHRLSTQTTHE